MRLRGREAKEKFVKEYKDVKVLTYAVVLNGYTKINLCGRKLTDKYYQFSVIHRNAGRKEVFCLGYDCGEKLMQMLSIPKNSMRFFNLFCKQMMG